MCVENIKCVDYISLTELLLKDCIVIGIDAYDENEIELIEQR